MTNRVAMILIVVTTTLLVYLMFFRPPIPTYRSAHPIGVSVTMR